MTTRFKCIIRIIIDDTRMFYFRQILIKEGLIGSYLLDQLLVLKEHGKSK